MCCCVPNMPIIWLNFAGEYTNIFVCGAQPNGIPNIEARPGLAYCGTETLLFVRQSKEITP